MIRFQEYLEIEKTYMMPAMVTNRTGRPSPTLSPMMSLLLRPPLSPPSIPLRPVGDADEMVGGGGT